MVRAACPFSSFFKKAASVRTGAAGTGSADTTLLARLGGDNALHATIDLFYHALPKDPAVSRFFEKTDMARLKEHQARPLRRARAQICGSGAR